MLFSVTFEIVTPESAEHGDCEESGFVARNVGLRHAVDYLFATRTSHVDGIEFGNCDDRSVSIGNGMEFRTGARESRTLHFPPHMSDSTRGRILQLVDGRAGFTLTRGF